jgi:S1-C subfamily serine protease
VEIARRVVPELIKFGKVKRGWIDIIPVQITNPLYKSANLSQSKGLLISRITAGGKAAAAGLQGGSKDKSVYYGNSVIYLGGDIIVEVDGFPVSTYTDLFSALEDNKAGDIVKVVFYRGKDRKETNIVLTDRPENLIM